MTVLAIDAGTTGVTALVVAEDGRVVRRGYEEFPQHFPRPGWVEHEPEQIWQATLSACRQALDGQPVTAIGITNQRETAVLWDRRTLAAPRRAIVWQDRRTGADLRPAARGRPRGPGPRADRAAPRPLLHRDQAELAGRERRAGVVGCPRRRGRRRHGGLLPRRPADGGPRARHRRLQRLPHAAVRPRRRRLVGRAVRAVRRARERAAAGGAVVRRGRPHRPGRVPRAGPAGRRDRR